MNKKNITKLLNRRQVLKYGLYGSIAAAAPALWTTGCAKFKPQKKPNVLLILLDTARADKFSSMGYKRNTSPNIDAFFAQGTIFQKAYSTACWTLPAHGSLFTGLYPIESGANSETLHLPQTHKTLAQAMTNAGYDTTAFICNSWVSAERGFARGFNEYNEMWRESQRIGTKTNAEEAAVTKTVQWLEKRKNIKNPFFLFMNLNGIHLPYRAKKPFLSQFLKNKYNNKEINRIASITAMWPYLAGKYKLSKKDFQIMNDLYDAEVVFTDYLVKQVFDQLTSMGILDDTLVILTSDHGENLGEHGRIDHNLSMHETTLHIPLMMRYPNRFKPATRDDDLVSILDIAPTILDICGVNKEMQNLNIEKTSLVSQNRDARVFIIASNEKPRAGIALMKQQYPQFDTKTIDYRLRTIRTKLHKLIWTVDKDMQLFDLKNDPRELKNLANSQPEIKNKLHKILVSWLKQTSSAAGTAYFKGQDEESLKLLRSLGYIK
ncbi:MAG: sulfatase-like hydrolase/transferase [Planctomycetes bacterium]|nr:sulfatase-like hydrolase/transferase [Planctomycetota bacterium]